jgi:hypothetical protein
MPSTEGKARSSRICWLAWMRCTPSRINLFPPDEPDQHALLRELHLSPSDSEPLPARNFAKGSRRCGTSRNSMTVIILPNLPFHHLKMYRARLDFSRASLESFERLAEPLLAGNPIMKRPDTRMYKSAQRHLYLDSRVSVSRRFGQ